MKLLVTGAAGFIGCNFVHHMLCSNPDCHIIGLDKLTYAGNFANLSDIAEEYKHRFKFVKGDICDQRLLEELLQHESTTGIVNFAAESHVDRSIQDSQLFLQSNVNGTHTLLNAALKAWKSERGLFPDDCKFVQISTDEVYGVAEKGQKFTEKNQLAPRNPYSASKAAADHMVMAYHHTHGLPTCITRCTNNYGSYQFPEKLIPLVIRNALSHESLPIYGDGQHVRDWLHVVDHCRAIESVLNTGHSGCVYNIGAENEVSNLSLVKTIIKSLSERTNDEMINERLIRYVDDRPGHDRRYAIDATLIKEDLGWQATIGFEEGLASTIEWYLENRDWIEQVISGEYLAFYERNYSNR
jgi:dTDP-glucose 4,6-dehydratase